MDCIIDAETSGQNSDEVTSYYGGKCVGESIPPWVIGRVVETYNAFAGIENPAAFMDAVANALAKAVSCGIHTENKQSLADLLKALEQLEAAKGAAK